MDIAESRKRPVFIVSTGRAGSQMMALVLAKHPKLCAFHEPYPHMNTEALKIWLNYRNLKRIERKIITKRNSLINQVLHNGFIYIESSHYCSHLIKELHSLFNARFLYIYRDGRDFVRSGMERLWYKNRGYLEQFKTFIRRRFLIDIGDTFIDFCLIPPNNFISRLEKITWLWVEKNKTIMRYLALLPKDDKFFLRLEDFNQESLVDLHEFLCIDINDNVLKEMLEMGSKNPNRTKTFTFPIYNDWHEWEKRQFKEIAGDVMNTLGYRI